MKIDNGEITTKLSSIPDSRLVVFKIYMHAQSVDRCTERQTDMFTAISHATTGDKVQ